MKKIIKNKNKGFTLVELMVTVMIVGLLASFALPTYRDYTKKARWAEARAALIQASMNMEREFSTNNIYSGATVGVTFPEKSESKNFTLSFEELEEHSFKIIATPSVEDSECNVFSITQASEKGASGSLSTEKCWGIN